MADDVKQAAPLRGGRQRANHIQVHRIELGKWERDNLAKPVASVLDDAMATASTVKVATSVAVVAAGGAAVGAVYVAWRIGKSIYGWVEDVKDFVPDFNQAITSPQGPLPTGVGFLLRFMGIGDGEGAL